MTRTLLTAETAQIPSAYTQIYDKLVGEFGSGYGVGTAAIAKVLDEAEVYDASRDRIWNTVVGKKDSLAREEVWVALAMAGLVAEGEEVSIDAVDDRRRSERLRVHCSGRANANRSARAVVEIAGPVRSSGCLRSLRRLDGFLRTLHCFRRRLGARSRLWYRTVNRRASNAGTAKDCAAQLHAANQHFSDPHA